MVAHTCTPLRNTVRHRQGAAAVVRSAAAVESVESSRSSAEIGRNREESGCGSSGEQPEESRTAVVDQSGRSRAESGRSRSESGRGRAVNCRSRSESGRSRAVSGRDLDFVSQLWRKIGGFTSDFSPMLRDKIRNVKPGFEASRDLPQYSGERPNSVAFDLPRPLSTLLRPLSALLRPHSALLRPLRAGVGKCSRSGVHLWATIIFSSYRLKKFSFILSS